MGITTEISRRDAIIIAMTPHFLLEARNASEPPASARIPTEDELRKIHHLGGDEWHDLLDELCKTAAPLVDEQGQWTRTVITYSGEETVTETLGLEEVLEAAATAYNFAEDIAASRYAAMRAAIAASEA